jgi:hypothetical protein
MRGEPWHRRLLWPHVSLPATDRSSILEASLYVNDAFRAYDNKPARARLRGLVRNPAISGTLLRRLVDAQFKVVQFYLGGRRDWSDEQFDSLADHPNPDVRVQLAEALHAKPEQRARLVEDPAFKVLQALAGGPTPFDLPIAKREPLLPKWAYDRLVERDARLRDDIVGNRWAPRDLRERLSPSTAGTAAPVDEPPLDRLAAEEMTRNENVWDRARAAADPRMPTDLVATFAIDPSPAVRLAASMHPSLSEQQRAAIDYHVAPGDRITPARWAMITRDPQQQRQCAYSSHVGLRRSVSYNTALSPDLVAVLATDDDFAVRLLLCENHSDVPGETVLATYLGARTLSRGRLLDHPALQSVGLACLAEASDPAARCLVVLDPDAPPALLELLSHDPHPAVRASTAHDPRLSPARVLELFDDPMTTEHAAANPHLPVHIMEGVLADAVTLADEQIEGTPTIYLGNWKPEDLPPGD